jgi:hypothetical protein
MTGIFHLYVICRARKRPAIAVRIKVDARITFQSFL